MTEVRLITFKSAILARFDSSSSCIPSAKNAFSVSSLKFSNGSTAIPVVDGWWTNSVFQIKAPIAAERATTNTALVGFRRTHFLERVMTPV
jgi:hypothetical protein